MNLATALQLWFGGAGSGCRGDNCGRPKGTGNSEKLKGEKALHTSPTYYNKKFLVSPTGQVLEAEPHVTHDSLLTRSVNEGKFDKKYKDNLDAFLQSGAVRITLSDGYFDHITGNKVQGAAAELQIEKLDTGTLRRAHEALKQMDVDYAAFEVTNSTKGWDLVMHTTGPKARVLSFIENQISKLKVN